jgi:DNA-binding Lrp family transcriptional regulator
MKRTESHLNLEKEEAKEISPELYYLNPVNQIIHIALGIKELREDLTLLSKRLDMSAAIINNSLRELDEAGIITWGPEIVVNKTKIHLPEKSPLFWSWKTQLNLLSLNKSQNSKQLGHDNCYNFSVVFSCDEECKGKIQKEYFDFLKKVEELVSNAPAEKVYQMNYDLINWA